MMYQSEARKLVESILTNYAAVWHVGTPYQQGKLLGRAEKEIAVEIQKLVLKAYKNDSNHAD